MKNKILRPLLEDVEDLCEEKKWFTKADSKDWKMLEDMIGKHERIETIATIIACKSENMVGTNFNEVIDSLWDISENIVESVMEQWIIVELADIRRYMGNLDMQNVIIDFARDMTTIGKAKVGEQYYFCCRKGGSECVELKKLLTDVLCAKHTLKVIEGWWEGYHIIRCDKVEDDRWEYWSVSYKEIAQLAKDTIIILEEKQDGKTI